MELTWLQVKDLFQPSDFVFDTTEQISENHYFIQQDVSALNFALNLNDYSIFIASEDHFLDKIRQMIEDKATSLETPDDLCYVFNFDEPNKPNAVYISAGVGARLSNDLKEFTAFLKNELKFSNTLSQEQDLVNANDIAKDELFAALKTEVLKLGFKIKDVDGGWSFVASGHKIKYSEANAALVKQLAQITITKIHDLDDQLDTALTNIFEEELLKQISAPLHKLKTKYSAYPELLQYFQNISDDILENAETFAPPADNPEGESALSALLPMLGGLDIDEFLKRYEVNVIVDNGATKGAPVILATECDYSSLLGNIVINDTPEVSNIIAGELHKARGGFLIVKAADIVERIDGWDAIAKTLKTGFIAMKDIKSDTINKPKMLEPAKITANVRIIMVGSHYHHEALKEYSAMFDELFKLRIDFADCVAYTKNMVEVIGYEVQQFTKAKNLKPVTTAALLRAIRKTQERSDKINLDFRPIMKFIEEANSIAADEITAADIDAVDNFHKTLLNKVHKNAAEDYLLERTLIDVSGAKVGEINGLCVYDLGEYSLGQPAKITATSYRGKKGIINIEKVAKLSGEIHTKGVEIIEGFIGNRFAKHIDLNLSCKICMEQSYGGLDGDSASSAELYAIISSIADIPIKQNLAVTGSINQYGCIQPVGGLNEKIEGFFRACQSKGLTGDQGVIIPHQNTVDLVLSDEILNSIKDSRFHIYTIKHYEEGIELLTGLSSTQVEYAVIKNLMAMNMK
ncbi:AAA family ATPase [Candidatus Epulonipiscium viviparus]|uniref:AAA family ATPase n=1 Tax=Candidatus Epulonipiscium viviparus TaxID=420336 RepID=UPI0027380713|nr:AAA family ATPase [Candidatus Epulopiscium viviparus]